MEHEQFEKVNREDMIQEVKEIPGDDFFIKAIYKYVTQNKSYELYRSKFTILYRKEQRYIYSVEKGDTNLFTLSGRSFGGDFNHITSNFCKFKYVTNDLLKGLGVRANEVTVYKNIEEIKAQYQKYNWEKAVVVKDALSFGGGKDVYLNISDYDSLISISTKLFNRKKLVHIEDMLPPSKEYRMQMFGGKFYMCVQRDKASIVGDGTKTVKELIAEKNSKRFNYSKAINVDEITRGLLKKDSLTLDSVIPANRKLYLKETANYSQGGEVVDVSRDVNSILIQQMESVSSFFQLRSLGFDIMTSDITKTLEETEGVVLEVNSAPEWSALMEINGLKVVETYLESLFNKRLN